MRLKHILSNLLEEIRYLKKRVYILETRRHRRNKRRPNIPKVTKPKPEDILNVRFD